MFVKWVYDVRYISVCCKATTSANLGMPRKFLFPTARWCSSKQCCPTARRFWVWSASESRSRLRSCVCPVTFQANIRHNMISFSRNHYNDLERCFYFLTNLNVVLKFILFRHSELFLKICLFDFLLHVGWQDWCHLHFVTIKAGNSRKQQETAIPPPKPEAWLLACLFKPY